MSLTSSDPEPAPGTVVLDATGQRWLRAPAPVLGILGDDGTPRVTIPLISFEAEMTRIEDAGRDQANAMINDMGDMFYPDGPEDAQWFREQHGARFVHGDPWRDEAAK